jgi:hypothetical protein
MFKKSLLSLSVACLLTALVPTAVLAQASTTSILVPAPAAHVAIPVGSTVTGGTATTTGGVTTVTGATVTLPGGAVLTNVTIVNAALVPGSTSLVAGGAIAQSAVAAIGATAAVAAGTTLAAGTILGVAVVAGVLVTVVSDGASGTTISTTGSTRTN